MYIVGVDLKKKKKKKKSKKSKKNYNLSCLQVKMPGRREDIQRRLKRAAENSQNIAEIFKKQKIESSDSQTQESSSDTDLLASRRPSSADRSLVHGAN